MSHVQNSTRSMLDDVVCRGVAIDVFHADQARRLLEELDSFIEPINERGLGKRFFANLQLILDRHLYLSISRLYEPHSARNPSRSIPAAVHLISSHTSDLQVVNRKYLIDFLSSQGHPTEGLVVQSDEQLSESLARHLQAALPKPDGNSSCPLDRALANLKRVRDKALARHERLIAPRSSFPPGPSSLNSSTSAETLWFSLRALISTCTTILNATPPMRHHRYGDFSRRQVFSPRPGVMKMPSNKARQLA
jgi:hypothetical protein